jgi:hypothetical protein
VSGGVVLSATDEGVHGALDALAGDGPALADDPVLDDLARRMDDLGAHAGVLVDSSWGAQSPRTPTLPPWAALAGGVLDDDGPVVVFLVAFADEDDAEAGAATLAEVLAEGASALSAEPWSSLLPDAEVTVDGAVVEVRAAVEPGRANLWNRVVFARDDLFAVA